MDFHRPKPSALSDEIPAAASEEITVPAESPKKGHVQASDSVVAIDKANAVTQPNRPGDVTVTVRAEALRSVASSRLSDFGCAFHSVSAAQLASCANGKTALTGAVEIAKAQCDTELAFVAFGKGFIVASKSTPSANQVACLASA